MSRKNNTAEKNVQISVEGEMTIYRAAELKASMLPEIERAQKIEIDLSHVTEIDSAGLQLMVAAKLEAIQRGKALHFTGHSKPVMDMLDLFDLGAFFGDQIVISSHVS
ncbi:MAG TPA: anti-sigma factor antagonist [Gallionellaceae bacterium]|nr:anti-sigma factor antagonist [Gallionellaceae bacterium]